MMPVADFVIIGLSGTTSTGTIERSDRIASELTVKDRLRVVTNSLVPRKAVVGTIYLTKSRGSMGTDMEALKRLPE
jgi:hypothetical protein